MFDTYSRQRDTKKVSEIWKGFFEECGKGLPQFTYILDADSDPVLPLSSQPATQEQQSSNIVANLHLQKRSMLETVDILLTFCKRTTQLIQGGMTTYQLRDKLFQLESSEKVLEKLLAYKAATQRILEEKQLHLGEVGELIANCQTQVELTNQELVQEAAAIQQVELTVKSLENDCSKLETEKSHLSKELSTLLDPSKLAGLNQYLVDVSNRLVEAKNQLTASKRGLESLELQLSHKKSVIDSKMKLQETVRKMNYDLEEKILTAKKGGTACYEPISHRKAEDRGASGNLLPNSLAEPGFAYSYDTPKKYSQAPLSTSLPVAATSLSHMGTHDPQSPSQLIFQMEHALQVSLLSRQAQDLEAETRKIAAELRFQEEKNKEVMFRLDVLQGPVDTGTKDTYSLGKRSLQLLEEDEEQFVKAELQFLKQKYGFMQRYLDWKRDQSDESSKISKDITMGRLQMQSAYLEPMNKILSELLAIEEAEALANIVNQADLHRQSMVFSSMAPSNLHN